MRLHPGAVARLQAMINEAEQPTTSAGAIMVDAGRFALTIDQIAVSHYTQRLVFEDQLVARLREGLAGKLSERG